MNIKKIWYGIRSALAPSDDHWYNPFRRPTTSGVKLDEYSSLNISAVFNAIGIISGSIGSLPLSLYKRSGESKEPQPDHKLSQLLSARSNPETTAMTLRETLQAHVVSWGNSYAEIVRDQTGTIQELWVIPPNRVTPKRRGKELVYEVTVRGSSPEVLSWSQVLHTAGLGFDGLMGYSVLNKARESFGLTAAAEEFGSRFFGEGTHPSVVVRHPGRIGEGAKKNLEESLSKAHSGLGKAHRLMLLEEKMEMDNISVPPEDAQFLQTREFQIPEVARWFNIQPSKLKDHSRSTFNNIEHLSIDHVIDCLMPWLIRSEQAYNMQLLTPEQFASGYYFHHTVEGLLRGDSETRAKFYKAMFDMAVMSPNEIRAKENMNPVPHGDMRFVPLNMVPLEQAAQQPKPVKTLEQGEDGEDEDLPATGREYWQGETRGVSILARDRVTETFYPLFMDTSQRLLERETEGIRGEFIKRASTAELKLFLNEYYRGFQPEVIKAYRGLFKTYMEQISLSAFEEIGAPAVFGSGLQRFVADYTENYAVRHVAASAGQLTALLGTPEAVVERMDDWLLKRAEKISTNETVRASSSISTRVYHDGGASAVWHIRGKKTCPYCKRFDGRKVRSGGAFVDKGSTVDGNEGDDKMLMRSTKRHPPLHNLCDCYVSAGG